MPAGVVVVCLGAGAQGVELGDRVDLGDRLRQRIAPLLGELLRLLLRLGDVVVLQDIEGYVLLCMLSPTAGQ
jgi:hypothetical protein